MYWNPQTLQSAAANATALERARGIAYPFRWENIFGNETILWGEYKTGAEPFHTAVHLHQLQFTCSCPSRQRPCKHVLALVMLYLQGSDAFQVWHDHPDWVQIWLEKQEKKAAKAREKPAAIEPPEKTWLLMQSGIIELQAWLQDLARHGLADTLARDSNYWHDFAARMVDAKLGGIGRRIRGLAQISQLENAHEYLLAELAELYLFARAFQQMEQLPTGMQQELLNFSSVNLKKEEVLAQAGIVDTWYIIGQTEKMEENLRQRRTWLLGQATNAKALLLDFVFGNADFSEQWEVGKMIKAELVFYPGSFRQRALVRHYTFTGDSSALNGYATWSDFLEDYAEALAANPWLGNFPVLIDAAVPIVKGKQLFLIDNNDHQLPASTSEENAWKLLALSGGHPIQVFGEWTGKALTPLTVLVKNRLITF